MKYLLNKHQVTYYLEKLTGNEQAALKNKLLKAREAVEEDGRINLQELAEKLFPDKNTQDQRARIQRFLKNLERLTGTGKKISMLREGSQKSPLNCRYVAFLSEENPGIDELVQGLPEIDSELFNEEKYIESQGRDPRITDFNIAISYAKEDDGAVQTVVKAMDSHLKTWADANGVHITWFRDRGFPKNLNLRNKSKAIPNGNNVDREIDDRFSNANIVLGFLSSSYIASDYIRENEWAVIRKADAYQRALVEINPHYDKNNAEKLFPDITKIQHSTCNINKSSVLGEKENETICNLCKDIMKKFEEQQKIAGDLGLNRLPTYHRVICELFGIEKTRLMDSHKKHDEFNVKLFENPLAIVHDSGNETTVDVIDHIIEWLKGDLKSGKIDYNNDFATLLGEYGMGKTFTSRMLTRKINANTKHRAFYFDLRMLQNIDLGKLTLKKYFGHLIENREMENRLKPEELIEYLRTSPTLVIFDGLDELASKNTRETAHRVIGEIWKLIKQPDGNSAKCRLLVTCRTNYFRDNRDFEDMLFLPGRTGRDKRKYLTLEIQPFTREQIISYLNRSLGEQEATRALDVIKKTHNLIDLAERPYLLSQITRYLYKLEEKSREDRTINAVTLYKLMEDDWYSRDYTRHRLSPDHKKILMRLLAVEYHIRGIRSMDVRELDEWLL